MKLVHLASRRSAARRSLLAIIALTFAVLTAVLAGISGTSHLAATGALRSLAAASGSDGFFRIHTSQSDDATEQQRAAEEAFAELGLTNGLQISTAPYSPPRPLVPSGGSATNLPSDLTLLPVGWTPTTTPAAGSLEPFTPSGTTPGGTPPGGTTESGRVPAALEVSTADALGLAPGDTFAVEGADGTVRLELVAALKPTGPDAAFLDPVPVQGAETVPTAVVVPPDAIPRLTGDPKVQWVFTVDADTADAAELPRLAEGLRQLPQRLGGDTAVNSGGVVPSGGLAGVLSSAADATQSVRAVLPIALVVLVALSAVTVVQFTRLLAGTRTAEDRLLDARGLALGQRAAVAALEIVPLAVGGCLLGWAAAVVLGPLLSAGGETGYVEGMGGFAAASWTVPLLCAGIAAGVFVGDAVLAGLREHNPQLDAVRTARVASFSVLAVLLAATALSLWQFLLYRSPLVASGGALRVNPLAAPAPALLLLAGAALALVVTGWLARGAERSLASRPRLGVLLAAQQVSRRAASYIIPIALITVTVGTATFTAAYAQTTARSQDAASQLGNGSDVRITLPGPQVVRSVQDVPSLTPYRDGGAVTAGSLAFRSEARLASISAPLLAVDAAALPGLLSDGRSLLDVDGLSAALAFEPPAPEPALTLTPSATQVRMQFTSRGTPQDGRTADDGATSRAASVTAWIRTEAGDLVPVRAGTLALSGSGDQAHSLSFALPEGLRPAALVAVDLSLEPSAVERGYELELTGVSSDGGIGNGQGRFIEDPTLRLAPGVFGAGSSGIEPLDEGVGVRFPAAGSVTGAAEARLLAGDGAPLPVALTDGLLADLDLAVGDPVSLRPGGVEIDGVVAAAVPVLPGTTESSAGLVDLQAYGHASLAVSPAPPRAGEIWLSSTDRDATAAAAAQLAGPGAAVSTADNNLTGRFLAPAPVSLWIGALGALLIGGAALSANLLALVQSRRSEVAVLRALGMQARDQVRGRRWEVLGVGGAAVVLGLLAGLGVAALTVPLLAQAVVVNASEALQAPLSVAALPLLGVLAGQVLILVLAAWFYGERVRRQALAPAVAVEAP